MSNRALPPPNTSVIQSNTRKKIFKIIIIGDSNVGKTCLTYRFCEGRFPKRTEATIGVDFREKTVPLENDAVKLQIWDTAGQERFRRSMVPHYYRSVNAVVFVYDITKPETFYNLPFWIEECNHYNLTSEIPRILVGNKCDEVEAAAGREEGDATRPPLGPTVGTHLAQRFADEHQMPLFETSAKDDSRADHVEAIFLTLAHKLRNAKPMMSPSYGRSLSSTTTYSSVRDLPRASGGTSRSLNIDETPYSGFSCC